MRRRTAQLPLHGGRAPRWLFRRMAELAGAVTMAVVDEYGPREMLRRLSDPWWFQAFACVLGFDWHSSGVTTVTCGALKEAARRYGDDLGILVAGGKGRTSRQAPREIAEGAERWAVPGGEGLVYASRMSAKVDSAAVQDGYQLYHHSFFFAPDGAWCVVQQGMDGERGWARRYHWEADSVDDFVCEPHAGVRDLAAADEGGRREASGTSSAGQLALPGLLNLAARESEANRSACAEVVRADPDRMAREALRLTEGPTLFAPEQHRVLPDDVDPGHLRRVLRSVHEEHPDDFETLLGARGVGPAAVRSLSLLAEVIHDAPASRRDLAAQAHEEGEGRRWADYSYAHGGKDGHPYPVDRETYDRSIEVLHDAVRRARLGDREKSEALRRLAGAAGERQHRTVVSPGEAGKEHARAARAPRPAGGSPGAAEVGREASEEPQEESMDVRRWSDDGEGEPGERRLREELEEMGYRVSRYVYPPGTTFPEHTHDVDKIDAVVSGRFRITVEGEEVVLGPGDWVEVPRGMPHTAEVVGDEPVVSLDAAQR